MARIFLCHASEDKDQVRDVYHRLDAIPGFEPWLDEEELLPGQIWEEEIPRALKASDFILLFFSRNSVAKRGYIQREMKLALDAWQEIPGTMIHTIPVRLDECEIPEPFRRYHYANLFDPRGFDRLVRALHHGLDQREEQISEPLETPPAYPQPAMIPPAIEGEEKPGPNRASEPSPQLPKNQPRPQRLLRNPTIIAALITAIAALIAATIPEVRTFITQQTQKPPVSRPTPTLTDNAPDQTRQTPSTTQESPKSTLPPIHMEFVKIPAGSFMMGTPKEQLDAIAGDNKDYRGWIEDETPQHRVTISKPFYMGKYEVTQAQWKAVMGENPSRFKGDDRPVENVSWEDVQQFIQKLNEREGKEVCRLPTEAEWEYAARADTTTVYSFGDNASQLGDYAWYGENSGSTTHPVGDKKPNAWGLYDMHGNVWEWAQDWYGPYTAEAVTDPSGPATGAYRVIRGGGWDRSARGARSARRYWSHPGYRSDDLGFRCLSSASSK